MPENRRYVKLARSDHEVELTGPEADFHPAATYARAPGCYAYQLDTLRSSSLIIFEVRIR